MICLGVCFDGKQIAGTKLCHFLPSSPFKYGSSFVLSQSSPSCERIGRDIFCVPDLWKPRGRSVLWTGQKRTFSKPHSILAAKGRNDIATRPWPCGCNGGEHFMTVYCRDRWGESLSSILVPRREITAPSTMLTSPADARPSDDCHLLRTHVPVTSPPVMV